MSSVVLFLADGFEEIEALSVVDVLRRGGIEIYTMSITNNKEVVGKSNIKVIADMTFDKNAAIESEMIIFPGGSVGMENLKNSKDVVDVLKYFSENKKNISAICASPSILGINGVLNGYKAICYPGLEKFLYDAEIVDKNVVCDRNIITSKGPGTTIDFALAILNKLKGAECADSVSKGLLWTREDY